MRLFKREAWQRELHCARLQKKMRAVSRFSEKENNDAQRSQRAGSSAKGCTLIGESIEESAIFFKGRWGVKKIFFKNGEK
jgi:hypothetical protein